MESELREMPLCSRPNHKLIGVPVHIRHSTWQSGTWSETPCSKVILVVSLEFGESVSAHLSLLETVSTGNSRLENKAVNLERTSVYGHVFLNRSAKSPSV